MLAHLHIRRFAIIDESELELQAGMTVLTGETGAGKSILLDALGAVLGERANSDNIQQGAERAEVTATFAIDNLPEVQAWLIEHDLDEDGECLLRRVIASSGKSRASINGRPSSVQQLRELGSQLVTVHGQHEHQALSQSASQRQLLDRYGRNNLPSQLAAAHDAWQIANQRLQNSTSESLSRQQRLDMVQFQLQEFDALDIGGSSIDDIESEHRWLANAERLISLGMQSLAALEDDGATASLTAAQQHLDELVGIDERLREALDLVESAAIQSTEAASMLRTHVSALEHDDARLAWLDERLASLHGLARKHQISMQELSTVEQNLRDEYDELTQPELQSDELERTCNALRETYLAQAQKLSRLRKRNAKKLGGVITEAMQTLGMKDGSFSIDVQSDSTAMHKYGQDTITFMVSPNPGVSEAPLSRVASGGELSRISLCVQLATLESQPVSTVIFDEVDAGIGGAIAETVGRLLRQVGGHAQVLCVTHLPQVAAQAHHHMRVQKTVSKEKGKGKTNTRLDTLDTKAKRDEIARMLGGVKITAKSRQHAQEMLDSATGSPAT